MIGAKVMKKVQNAEDRSMVSLYPPSPTLSLTSATIYSARASTNSVRTFVASLTDPSGLE